MNKKQAIEFLKQSLGEIRTLLTLPYNNDEYPLWHKTIEGILEEVFGRASGEYRNFSEAMPSVNMFYEEQEDYLKELKMRETAILAIINKHEILGIEEKPTTTTKPTYTDESPIHLFDAMKFHPRIIKVSRKRFASGNYEDAIYRAFVEVNNFVKGKTDSDDDGKSLMSNTFNCKNPIIKLNALITQSDKDEQEGFMHLFMGAMQGIRNPKAHENLSQRDPLRTLEYLALANLLMRRVEEGKVVKTKPPRTRWDWERFLIATKERCGEETLATISRLHDFTKNNASELNWGTGAVYGSFTFRHIRHGRMVSIFTVYSDGTVYFSFGSMKNKGVKEDILESFRKNLNEIPEIRISQDAVTINNKYPYIRAKTLTKPENMTHFQDAVLSLYQQLENSKEHSS